MTLETTLSITTTGRTKAVVVILVTEETRAVTRAMEETRAVIPAMEETRAVIPAMEETRAVTQAMVATRAATRRTRLLDENTACTAGTSDDDSESYTPTQKQLRQLSTRCP